MDFQVQVATLESFTDIALKVRMHVLHMVYKAGASHVGSCYSVIDILVVLYWKYLHIDPLNPLLSSRDRLIISKGHAAAALYAILAERGFFPTEALDSFCAKDSYLLGHVSHYVPGVECSSGSLGHGLPIGCGMALAAVKKNDPWKVVIILSDGEMGEGSNWEAFLFAGHHKLHNLTVIIDYNKIQSLGFVEEILSLEPLHDKFVSFGWEVHEIDGHDLDAIESALRRDSCVPKVIIAHTVKGKGVGFMHNCLAWHYKSPNELQFEEAKRELLKTK